MSKPGVVASPGTSTGAILEGCLCGIRHLEADPEWSRNEDLRFFNCLVVLCPPCSSQDDKDCKSGLRDSSGYDSLGFAKNRGVRSWPGLESRAPNIGAMGCAMQAIPPPKSGR